MLKLSNIIANLHLLIDLIQYGKDTVLGICENVVIKIGGETLYHGA
jgi:hypothetical protein